MKPLKRRMVTQLANKYKSVLTFRETNKHVLNKVKM